VIEVLPLAGLPEVRPGDDLAALLAAAMTALPGGPRAKDILVVTQKIVSKAENLFVDLETVEADDEARALAETTRKDPRLVALILRESTAIVRAVPGVLITRHRSGCVMANGGIDQSNLGPGGDSRVLLLPRDPDAAAVRLRDTLVRLAALRGGEVAETPALIISDSFGRPWRVGVTNVAIGAAGLPSLVDWRGAHDRGGRPMAVTQVALGDLAASAAGLVMGEADEGVPAAVIRGLAWSGAARPAADLIRPEAEDLFR
jgi:coenzyme F420-0:L-glutamate ligase/coenzyme F420-1:gamma-L-glutamate ligase